MSEISIQLRYNLTTGKKDIAIDFISDTDALPMEHEHAHRDVIKKLLGQGILTPDEVGEVTVTRGQQQAAAPASSAPITTPIAASVKR